MNNNELMHYGTPGMKWGRRKRPDGGYETSDAQPAQGYKPGQITRNLTNASRAWDIQYRATHPQAAIARASSSNRRGLPPGFASAQGARVGAQIRNTMNRPFQGRNNNSSRSPMDIVRNQQANMRGQIGRNRARAIMDRWASAPSANERVMNRYNQMQTNRRRLQATNTPGKATAEYYKNKNSGNKFSKSFLGGTSGKISDRRLRNQVAGRTQELLNQGADRRKSPSERTLYGAGIVNRLEADKVRQARRRRR